MANPKRKLIDIETMSILIVDDAKNMRTIIRKILKNLKIGGILHMAENGLEGLKILNFNPVDLVIVDWRMPIMNGPELLESIRNDSQLRDLPVLMVTAESERDIVMEVAEIEVDGYLLKPLTPAILDEKIKSIVHQANYPDKAAMHVKNARVFEELKNYEVAIKHMKHVVKLRPKASRHLRNLGLLYQKSGDEKTALHCLKKAALVNLQDAVTRQILGEIYWGKKDFTSAAEYYLEVVSLTRKFTDRAITLGEELLQNRMPRLAKNLFLKIISSSLKNNASKKHIVDLCMENQEWDFSKTLLIGLIKDYPSDFELVFKLGVVCENLNDFDGALKHFLAVDQYQIARVEVLLKIAKIYYDKQKVLQADEYLNRVLIRKPDNQEALRLRQLF
ncbi:MAG: response regulator [Pseudomonadota bacterium]